MKKAMIFLAAFALIGSSMLVGCKKGDNDPFLSLRSRKARFAGEWTVASFSETRTINNAGIEYTESDSYDGSTWVREQYNYAKDASDAYQYTVNNWKFSIDKKGEWSYVFDRTLNSINDSTVNTENWLTEDNGHWSFLGKNKNEEYKKKERVSMTMVAHTLTIMDSDTTIVPEEDRWTNDDDGDIWILDRLSNKEIIVKIKTSYSSVFEGITEEIEREFTLTQE